MSTKQHIARLLIALTLILPASAVGMVSALTVQNLVAGEVYASPNASVTVNFTPAYIALTDNVTSYDFGVVSTSSTTNTTTTYIGITNTSTVQTDITIAVINNTWTGGNAYTHSDTATPGADTVGLNSQRGGTWGASVVVVQYTTPQYIYENCAALTDFDYGLSLKAPTSYSDGAEKTNEVRIAAVAG